jgi:hypothetical protein
MANFDNNNTGAIWGNKDRKTDKHPTHTGSLNVEGVEYRVSAWVGDKSKNQPALSFKIQKKEPKQEQKQSAPKQEINNSDIPF